MNTKEHVATKDELEKSKVRMVIRFTQSGSSTWDFFNLPIAKANDASAETRIHVTLKTGREVEYTGYWIGEEYYMRPLFNSNGRLIRVHRNDYVRLFRAAEVVNWDVMPAKNFSDAMLKEYMEDELEHIMHRYE